MTERPILFKTDMVNAILEGRKKQTRRVVKVQETQQGLMMPYNCHGIKGFVDPEQLANSNRAFVQSINPYGSIGDVLWVRETWQETIWMHPSDENYGYIYKASENGQAWASTEEFKWKPSIYMPKAACRLKLKITNVRAERLQDISEQDAIYEGVRQITAHNDKKRHLGWNNYFDSEKNGFEILFSPKKSFETLWESINGNWETNPWVWVVEFERLEIGGLS